MIVALLIILGGGYYYTSVSGKTSTDKVELEKNAQTGTQTPALNTLTKPAWQPTQDLFIQYETPREILDVQFLAPNGKTVGFDRWKGQKLIVNIWATWCAPCVTELPSLDYLKGKIQGKGYDVIAISVDRNRTIQDIDQFLTKLNIKNLITFFDRDREVIRKIEIDSFPLTLVLDEQGRELGRYEGSLDWGDKAVLAALSKL